jgi:hypothetical protein
MKNEGALEHSFYFDTNHLRMFRITPELTGRDEPEQAFKLTDESRAARAPVQ